MVGKTNTVIQLDLESHSEKGLLKPPQQRLSIAELHLYKQSGYSNPLAVGINFINQKWHVIQKSMKNARLELSTFSKRYCYAPDVSGTDELIVQFFVQFSSSYMTFVLKKNVVHIIILDFPRQISKT